MQLPIAPPLFNADLWAPDGTFIARPDTYWPDAALALEVDSLRHHGDTEGWEYTQRRHSRMTTWGIMTMHASPQRIHNDWPELRSEVLASYQAGISRPAIGVRVSSRPQAA